MPGNSSDLTNAILAKTEAGQQEIATRALGLNPLLRRLLILVDGKRNATELAPMVSGQDVAELLGQLLEKGCIEIIKVVAPTPAPNLTPAVHVDAGTEAYLATLPPPETRTAKDVDMARNFMMNTVNTVFQSNTRLTLIETIFACQTPEDARRAYVKWAETMQSSIVGSKRLPEFQEKLAKVL